MSGGLRDETFVPRALSLARELIDGDRGTSLPSSARLRSAAILARQVLEAAVLRYATRFGYAEQASNRARLLMLFEFADAEVARKAHLTWDQLSQAVHVNGYELAPSRKMLHGMLSSVEEVVGELQRR